MTSASIPLLVAALAFWFCPRGTAQAPRRPAAAAVSRGDAGVHEGRCDDVDTMTDKLDLRDPNVAALGRSAAIARGRDAQAESQLRPVVSRAPTAKRRSSSPCSMLGRPDASSTRAGRPAGRDRATRMSSVGGARVAPPGIPRRPPRLATSGAPNDPAIQTGWGDCSSVYERPSGSRSRWRSRRSQMDAGADGSARALEDDNPPRAIALAKRAGSESVIGRHACLSGGGGG
jgi:hypothetical protein